MLSFSDFMKVFEAYQSYSASQAVAPVAPAPVAPASVASVASDQYASLDARLKMLEQVTPSIQTTQVTSLDDIIAKLV